MVVGRMARGGATEVVLIEGHDGVRRGLGLLLSRRGCRVLGMAGSASEGESILRELRPEVAIVGLHLEDEDGVSLVRRLRTGNPQLGVVIYTGVEDARLLADARDSGAEGLVLKASPVEVLVEAVRKARRGDRYVDPDLEAILEGPGMRGAVLTQRERQVFEYLAQGLTNT